MKYEKTQNTTNILLKKKSTLTHHLGHQVFMTKEINALGLDNKNQKTFSSQEPVL